MSRPAPIPFDPDAFGGVSAVQTALVAVSAPEAAEKGSAQPLTKRQKWRLSDLAESVYLFLQRAGQIQGEDLKAWRGRIAMEACGKRISQASHGDYKLIQAALLHARGREEDARRVQIQAKATPAAIALHQLRELCRETHTPLAYAETLAKRFYKGTPLQDLTARQLWTVVYTIRNNTNAKAGVGNAANRFKSKRRKSA